MTRLPYTQPPLFAPDVEEPTAAPSTRAASEMRPARQPQLAVVYELEPMPYEARAADLLECLAAVGIAASAHQVMALAEAGVIGAGCWNAIDTPRHQAEAEATRAALTDAYQRRLAQDRHPTRRGGAPA